MPCRGIAFAPDPHWDMALPQDGTALGLDSCSDHATCALDDVWGAERSKAIKSHHMRIDVIINPNLDDKVSVTGIIWVVGCCPRGAASSEQCRIIYHSLDAIFDPAATVRLTCRPCVILGGHRSMY